MKNYFYLIVGIVIGIALSTIYHAETAEKNGEIADAFQNSNQEVNQQFNRMQNYGGTYQEQGPIPTNYQQPNYYDSYDRTRSNPPTYDNNKQYKDRNY